MEATNGTSTESTKNNWRIDSWPIHDCGSLVDRWWLFSNLIIGLWELLVPVDLGIKLPRCVALPSGNDWHSNVEHGPAIGIASFPSYEMVDLSIVMQTFTRGYCWFLFLTGQTCCLLESWVIAGLTPMKILDDPETCGVCTQMLHGAGIVAYIYPETAQMYST